MPPLSTTAIAFAFGASATTYLGGRFALWLGDRFAWLAALTAGMILGIALIDLLPEAWALDGAADLSFTLPLVFIAGFVGNLMLDRALRVGGTTLSLRPHLGPASLTIHSLVDGLSIGLAFHVSLNAGIVIAIAILAHDFADGMNTVRLSLTGGRRSIAHAWLIADSLAPVLGAALGLCIVLDHVARAMVLALMAGAFVYIGVRELALLSHNRRNAPATLLAALGGMLLIGAILHFAG